MDEKIIALVNEIERRYVDPLSRTFLGSMFLMMSAFLLLFITGAAVLLLCAALLALL